MIEASATPASSANAPSARPSKPLKPPNPIWKYLGFGANFRPSLPSRNWLIFLSVTGGVTGWILYDKRETRRAQAKWARLVSHLAKESISPQEMPRKLTIYLQAPPHDGLRTAQEHFKSYVKPVLIASGMDWEFVQGRNEGDVQRAVAEAIRLQRRKNGEGSYEPGVVEATRQKQGIGEYPGDLGDLVLGRHAWKEYVHGLHEGWLGPLDDPAELAEQASTSDISLASPETRPGDSDGTTADAEVGATTKEPSEANKDKKPAPKVPLPFLPSSQYTSAHTSSTLPSQLEPSVPVSFPHILGFLNTPTRLYRFFNRRYLADDIGRETAALILCHSRPYHNGTGSGSTNDIEITGSADLASPAPDQTASSKTGMHNEVVNALVHEETDWPKSVHKERDKEMTASIANGDNKTLTSSQSDPSATSPPITDTTPKAMPHPWLDALTIDARITTRMRRACLTEADAQRARDIVVPEEEIEGWIRGSMRTAVRAARAWMRGGRGGGGSTQLSSTGRGELQEEGGDDEQGMSDGAKR